MLNFKWANLRNNKQLLSKTEDSISNKKDNTEHCGSGRMADSKENLQMRKNSQLTELNSA